MHVTYCVLPSGFERSNGSICLYAEGCIALWLTTDRPRPEHWNWAGPTECIWIVPGVDLAEYKPRREQ